MTTTRKDALRKLLAKGNLSGLETAKILLAELWEDEHARDAILSEAEQNTIRDRLTNPVEIRIYNDWIGAFPTICEVNHIAHIMFLMLERNLTSLTNLVKGYIVAAIILLEVRLRPTIVTEKQLEDLRDERKMKFFGEKHSLDLILYERAEQLVVPEGLSLENLLEDDPTRAAHSYRQASAEVSRLIESGQLRITHKKRVLTLLHRLEISKADSELLAIIDTTLSQEPTHKMEEPEPLLEKAYATGESLFETGLPEWLNHEDRSGEEYRSGIAVLKDPREEDLDNNGHYRDQWKSVEDTFLHLVHEGFWKALGRPRQEFLTLKLNRTKLHLSHFLFCQTLLQELAETLSFTINEDVDSWRHSLESLIEYYETTLRWAMNLNPKAKETFADIPAVNMDQIQPSPEVRSLVRKRLMEPLERDQWFQDCKEYHLKEALASVPRDELEGMLSGLGACNWRGVCG